MRMLKYKQVKLVKGNTYQITWIPAHLAQIGRPLKVRDSKRDEWSEGWVVATASAVNMTLDETVWGDEDTIWEPW